MLVCSWPAAGCAPGWQPAGLRGRWQRRDGRGSEPPGDERLSAGGGLAGTSSRAVSAPWCGASSPAPCATGSAGLCGGVSGPCGSDADAHPTRHCRDRTPFRPPATTASRPVKGTGGIAPSAHEKQTSHPATWRLIGTVLMTPVLGRDRRSALLPSLDQTRMPVSSWAPVPNCLEGKRAEQVAPGNRGYPGSSPAATRRHPPQARLVRAVPSGADILHDLTVEITLLQTDFLEAGALGTLACPRAADAARLPGSLAPFPAGGGAVTATARHTLQGVLLHWGRLAFALGGFAHRCGVQMPVFCLLAGTTALQ